MKSQIKRMALAAIAAVGLATILHFIGLAIYLL